MNSFLVQDESVKVSLFLVKIFTDLLLIFTKISSQLIGSCVLYLIVHISCNLDQVVLEVISIYLDAFMQYIKFLSNHKKHILIC